MFPSLHILFYRHSLPALFHRARGNVQATKPATKTTCSRGKKTTHATRSVLELLEFQGIPLAVQRAYMRKKYKNTGVRKNRKMVAGRYDTLNVMQCTDCEISNLTNKLEFEVFSFR